MITQERVLELYERANPVKDFDQLVTDLEAASYLANLQQRSSEVTQLDTRQTEQDHASRRPLLAIAAAAVVILGTALVLLTRDSEEPPAATDPSPTTIVTNSTTPETREELSPELEEALAVATAFNESRAIRDIDMMIASSIDGHVTGFIAQSHESMPAEFAWQDAVGWTTEVQDCRVTVPDEVSPTIVCEVTHQTAISEALGVGPYPGTYYMKVRFSGDTHVLTPIAETTVTEAMTFEFPSPEFVTETWRPFIEWLENTHPNDLDTMLAPAEVGADATLFLVGGERRPSLTEESTALWSQYVAEFVTEQS